MIETLDSQDFPDKCSGGLDPMPTPSNLGILAEKLNEIIEALNNIEKVRDFEESHDFVINAARKAAVSGSREDLQEYLRLRRENG